MQSRHLILCTMLAATVARAQSPTTGAIQGRVVDAASKEPVVGVIVTVISPSLIEPQTAMTDVDGVYKITDLLPGTYQVRFEDSVTTITRSNVRVAANTVVPVFQELDREKIVVHDDHPIPQIDVPSTGLILTIGRPFLDFMPIPGATIDAAAGAKAGVHNDGVGLAVSGSTGLENRFLVDGIDITGLTFGDIGTAVLNDFVEEIQVLSGGYNAEWGRAIGGIVNVVTKTGSNTFRGSVFGTVAPGFLSRGRQTTPSNASSIDVVADTAYSGHFGAELGGPIIRDRLWFYAGLAPQVARTDFTRITKRQSDCRTLLASGKLSTCDPRLANQGGFADGVADFDPSTGFFITDELDRETRSATSSALSSIAKLNLAVTPHHQAQISAILVPGRSRSPGLIGLGSTGSRSTSLTFDTAARWTSKFNDGATELEAVLAWHHSTLSTGANDSTFDDQPRQILHDGNLGVWSALGGESPRTATGCADGSIGSSDVYPIIVNCPVSQYATGGPGAIARGSEDRVTARLSLTQRGRFYGSHEIRAGLDIDDNSKQTARLFSGGAFIENFVQSGSVFVTRWVKLAALGDKDPRYDQVCATPSSDDGGSTGTGTKSFSCDFLSGTPGAPGTQVSGQTIDWAAYLRDSWQPRSNVTLNAGVRYEEQRLRYASDLRGKVDALTGETFGRTAMNLTGNWAPRFGATWDPTEVGRSKLWASYGRFFEAIPMDINDRSFGGEVSYRQTYNTGGTQPCGPVDPKIGGSNGLGCLGATERPAAEQLIGSSGVLVAPGIKAQYMDEFVAGAEFQLADDLKFGVVYQNRWLGRVIEDVSTDGAETYVIANPGEWSDRDETALSDRIARADDPTVRGRLQRQLDMFRGIRRFDRPARNYGAIEVSLSRRFARGLYTTASYTLSRTEGNFPGSVSYDNGQVDPNISSQYDLIELLANRRGRLPQDRPHSIKLDAFYRFDLGALDALTVGSRIRAVSGIPTQALGAHYLYGPNESFLLPRGQLGRSELETSVDLKLTYGRKLPRGMTAELFVDVFNLFNSQATFDVDNTYAPAIRQATPDSSGGTPNNVNPISGGTYSDLIFAKAIDGAGSETAVPTGRNPNFHRTTSRYAPSSAQIGFRLSF